MTHSDIELTLYDKLSPRTTRHLIECFGSAEQVFAATENELMTLAQLKPELAKLILSRGKSKQAAEELTFLDKHGFSALAMGDEGYPSLLAECCDPPHVLYFEGDKSLFGRPMLSMIGTREVTHYGMQMCEKLVAGLAEIIPDLVIVSGLAFGVDVACHRAALLHGLPTIAVMATPLNTVYPSFHTDIARDIVRSGGMLMTENHSKGHAKGHSFLSRNRIVAGISKGTVVVETPPTGGSLSTAQHAFDYDRTLMAVPGRATDWNSAGTNLLIKTSRAQMVCSADDIALEMGWKILDFGRRERKQQSFAEAGASLNDLQRRIMGLLKKEGAMGDQEIGQKSDSDFQDVVEALFVLECTGLLRMTSGKYEII